MCVVPATKILHPKQTTCNLISNFQGKQKGYLGSTSSTTGSPCTRQAIVIPTVAAYDV